MKPVTFDDYSPASVMRRAPPGPARPRLFEQPTLLHHPHGVVPALGMLVVQAH